MLLYWLWVSRRSSDARRRVPAAGGLFFAILQRCRQFDAGKLASVVAIHAFRIASSSLPGLIRSPPACAMRLVGLFEQQRCVRAFRGRSTSTSDLPNASILFRRSPGSGK